MTTIIRKEILKIEDFENVELMGIIASGTTKALRTYVELASLFGKTLGHATVVFKLYNNNKLVSEHLDLRIAIQKYNEL